eukprot:CAMPEP_0168341296 /NCGR_PEP_ID=MMETSP0213-20121227/14589_1 /TAXON_ID=151035 /ORGANISM="Euplotes harpa, Strain FSP1.4" /LENGTH=120 /DNA_ID=CAMNT_0008347725 /DNA_START=17 /DNA_END=379 /DNA_ORIENTATION=+
MEYSNSEISDSESRPCQNCQQFYGTKATNFMCSKCFKELSAPKTMIKEDPLGLPKSNVIRSSLAGSEYTNGHFSVNATNSQIVHDVEMAIKEEFKDKPSTEMESSKKSTEEPAKPKATNR